MNRGIFITIRGIEGQISLSNFVSLLTPLIDDDYFSYQSLFKYQLGMIIIIPSNIQLFRFIHLSLRFVRIEHND